MDYYNNEVPAYKKKVNKTVKKSKHKHLYVDCLIYSIDNYEYKVGYKSSYCSICGKVGHLVLETERVEGRSYSKLLNFYELFEKYKDIEHIRVDDVDSLKYIDLNNKNNK